MHTGVAGGGLSAALREGTSSLHSASERSEFQSRLLRGEITREAYRLFLIQAWHAHGALERAWGEAMGRGVTWGELFKPWHVRSGAIRRDIERLGGFQGDMAVLGSTLAFTGDVGAWGRDASCALVGALYVVEGATNGNKIIAKGMRAVIGDGPDAPTGYLDPHNAEQRTRWLALKAGLDALDLDEGRRRQAVDGAARTFDFILRVGDDVLRACPACGV